MELYGKIDRGSDGSIASEYPAWMLTKQIDDLKENIDQIERNIKSNRIPEGEVAEARQQQRVFKDRLDSIMSSKPKPSDNERNMLWKHYKSFGSKIQDTMFTLSDMKRGFADAHEEARRMSQPIIELSSEEVELAKTCNVRVTKEGQKHLVTRNGAAKVFKLIGRILGEPTNIEVLRQDKKSEAFLPSEIGKVKPLREELKAGTSLEELKAEIKAELMAEMQTPVTKSGKPDKRFKDK